MKEFDPVEISIKLKLMRKLKLLVATIDEVMAINKAIGNREEMKAKEAIKKGEIHESY